MLKKKVKNLQEYYYQWMCKHKDDADRLRGLLECVQDELSFCLFCDVEYNEDYERRIQHEDGCELAEELAEELAQAQADEYIESEDAHIVLDLE